MVIPCNSHGVGAALTFGNNFEFIVFIHRGDYTTSVRRMVVDDSNTNRFRHLTPSQNQCHTDYGTSASIFRASRQAATLVPLPATGLHRCITKMQINQKNSRTKWRFYTTSQRTLVDPQRFVDRQARTSSGFA